MKIAILTLGTRGDVQPYAVLGQALMLHGHEVTLSTAKNFEKLVRSYGIQFKAVEADFQAVLDSDDGKKMMKGNPFVIRRNLNTWIYPLIRESLIEFYRLANESDLVLYHVKTLADSFADQFPDKMIRASVLPVVEPTSEFANPSFSGLPIPGFLHRFSYSFASASIKLLSKPIGQFRESFGLSKKFKIPKVRNIYGISPAFLPVPKDYPRRSTYSGFWFGQSKEELPDDLVNFIKAGAPPLLLTFGSMPYKSKMDLPAVISRLTRQLNTRMIIVKGWGLTDTSELEKIPAVRLIDAAPYEKLFPLVKAVIHHGGIGTTAECLRAGKPFMICPVLFPVGDQYFWGRHSYKTGVAVRPIPLAKLNEKMFLHSINELLNNKTLAENALRMKGAIGREQGIAAVIDIIERRSY